MLSVAAPSSGLGGTLNPSPLSPPSKTQTTGRLGLRQKPKPLADSDVTVLNFEPATEPDSGRFGTVSAECVLIVYFQVTGTSPLRVPAPGSGFRPIGVHRSGYRASGAPRTLKNRQIR
jgi:hypothetical protein